MRIGSFFFGGGLIASGLAVWTPVHSAEPSNSNTCQVWIWVRASGVIQAAQIIHSSGAQRLDEACARTLINQQMRPRTVGAEQVDLWTTQSIRWDLALPKQQTSQTVAGEAPIPKLSTDQSLNLDAAYYPPNALQQRKEGICELRVLISAQGQVEKLALSKSTGFAELDRGCEDAIYAAQFDPAKQDGKNVAASTTIWLAWRLP